MLENLEADRRIEELVRKRQGPRVLDLHCLEPERARALDGGLGDVHSDVLTAVSFERKPSVAPVTAAHIQAVGARRNPGPEEAGHLRGQRIGRIPAPPILVVIAFDAHRYARIAVAGTVSPPKICTAVREVRLIGSPPQSGPYWASVLA